MLLVLTEEHKTHLSFLSTVDISGKRLRGGARVKSSVKK